MKTQQTRPECCALGVCGALVAGRALRALIYDVDALDPATHAAAALLVLAFAIGASILPAACAMRVSPLNAMRDEL